MLVFIPLTMFIVWAFSYYRKSKHLNITIYIFSLFILSLCLSVVGIYSDLLGEDGDRYQLLPFIDRVYAVVVFCILYVIMLYPFTKITYVVNQNIYCNNRRFFIIFCSILIAFSFCTFYVLPDIIRNLNIAEIAIQRADHYAGYASDSTSSLSNLPPIWGYILYFNSSTILLLPCLFFSLCFMNNKWWFNILMLLSSMSYPLYSLAEADRTEVAFYLLMFMYCAIFFWRFMKPEIKKIISVIMISVFSLAILYLILSTIVRFGERDTGTIGGIVSYGGQGFVNFSYFLTNRNPEYPHPERMFPLFNHLFYHIDSDSLTRDAQSLQQGFHIAVFPTVLGDFIVDLGLMITLCWTIMYNRILNFFTKKIRSDKVSIGYVIALFFMASIPIFGIFYYRYFHFTRQLTLLLVILILIAEKKKIV